MLIVCISVGVAFAQFVGIVLFHMWQLISKMIAKKYTLPNWNTARAQKADDVAAYYLLSDEQSQPQNDQEYW